MSAGAQGNGGGGVHTPILGPELSKEVARYEEDMDLLSEIKEKLKKLAAAMKNHGNVMFEVIQVFSLFQDVQAGQIRVLSDVDNVDSTLRSKLSQTQSDWNKMMGGATDGPGEAAAKDMIKQIKEIEAFIKDESGKKGSILDGASLKNLQAAISSIKSNFTYNGKNVWGNKNEMYSACLNWLWEMDQDGKNIPEVKNIQDGFQTVNQSVSELSSTTNTQLQFVENQYKQGMGEENAAMQAYQKLNSNTIRHFANQ